MNDEFFVEMCS